MALSTCTITLSTLFADCVTLSSYTAREQTDASGNSLYERVKLQPRDEDLIVQYAEEATVDAGKTLLPFGTFSVSNTALTFTFYSTYDVPNGFENLLKRFVIDWAMGAWLLDKLPERAAYFKSEAERLAEKMPTLIFRTKPTLS